MNDLSYIDQAFIRKLSGIVLDNLQNENFGVNDLARLSGISRFALHRRLRAISNSNISQFIREVRLKKAMELLQQHAGRASDIAYQVGFGSPTYFNKCFHEYYGYPPGEVFKGSIPEQREIKNAVENGHGKKPGLKVSGDEKLLSGIRRNRIIISLISSVFAFMFVTLLVFYRPSVLESDPFGIFTNKRKDLSIVVLPFKNLSDDPANQYFADGIMEDILNDLYRISDLKIISRTTSEHYRGTILTAGEIARQVNARYVLEGSIRRYNDKTRISVQLIDAAKDHHLWSDSFDRELKDIINIQGDIAIQVASKLKAVITDKEIMQIEKTSTNNPEAYDHYLRGRFLLHKANSEQRSDYSMEGVISAIRHYEKAIAADSFFTEAYAGLANAWFNLSAWGWYQPYLEGIQNAKYFCARALEIDPDCAEAHAVKGAYLIWPERRFEEGRKELRTAIRLNPNFSTTHQWYAQLYMITGPIEKAREHLNQALELEPYFWVTHNLNAWIYYFEEKYDKAIEACSTAREFNPKFIENNWLFFLNYTKLGEEEKALKELQEIAASYPDAAEYAAEIKEAYEENGVNGLYTWLIKINIHNPIPVDGMNGHPFFIAWWNAILDNTEETLYWLEKNMETQFKLYRYFNLIATNPDFDFLRAENCFQAIIEELGLSPYHTRKPC